ncbi:MAG TPA: alpha-glucan family phosphorylase, partial [Verrucomicrobiae bacterium]|nr:alpha-glucan family phosphorylase [Verrucomicrobiae bacterium]
TGYKRADLILSDLDRLRLIAKNAGKFQIVYAGKAHPHDSGGKDIIRTIFHAKKALRKVVPTVFLDEYNLEVGGQITSGVDLWLNTPQFPLEASGTSGMKAALNGVPGFSVIDGWWAEGWIEGITGWAIGNTEMVEDPASEVATLYDKMERQIIPMFYGTPSRYTEVMRSAIALNGSFFNTQRMVQQYLANAYMLREVNPPAIRVKQAIPALTGE